MIKAALILLFVALAVAAPADVVKDEAHYKQMEMFRRANTKTKVGTDGSPVVIEYNLGDQQHVQTGDAGNAVRGSYTFTSADGSTHTVNYIADERGYRVIGGTSFTSIAASGAVKPAKPVVAPSNPPKTLPEPVPAPPKPIAPPKPVVVPVAPPKPAAEPVAPPKPIAEPIIKPVAPPKPAFVAPVAPAPPAAEPVLVEPIVVPVPFAQVVQTIPEPPKPAEAEPAPLVAPEAEANPEDDKKIKYVPVPYPIGYQGFQGFQGYQPFGYQGYQGFPYYQGGYSPLSYALNGYKGYSGYGGYSPYNLYGSYPYRGFGGYVLKPVKVQKQGAQLVKNGFFLADADNESDGEQVQEIQPEQLIQEPLSLGKYVFSS